MARVMGAPLYYEEYGPKDAPALLLLHGLGGGNSVWAEVAKLLATKMRVLAPDLLGFGRSPWPKGAYTVDDHLAALESLLEHLGLDSAPLNLCGHSMGGILAAELAARRPEQVGKVALVSFPYFKSAEEVQDHVARFGLMARLTVSGHWGARATCGVMCVLRPFLKVAAPYLAPGLPPGVVRDAFQHNFTSYSRTLRNVIVQHRSDAALAALAHQPVLLVHGEEDRTAPLANIQPWLERFPRWRLEVIPEARHFLPIHQPEEVAQLLEAAFTSNVEAR